MTPRGRVTRGAVLVALALAATTGGAQEMPRGGFVMRTGNQVVAVFVTASWSRGLAQPELRRAIDTIWAAIRREAEAQQLTTMFVGVALDRDPHAGYRALEGVQFDQIVTGGWWLNMVSVQFMFRDHPGEASTPQLILIRRRIEVLESSIRVSPDSVVGRFIGPTEIAAYARRPRHL